MSNNLKSVWRVYEQDLTIEPVKIFVNTPVNQWIPNDGVCRYRYETKESQARAIVAGLKRAKETNEFN